MVETIRSLGHRRLPLYVLCFTIVGNPAGMRVGRARQRQFVSGHARAAVETVVDVPDHGGALSPDREETIMTIRFDRKTIKCRSINTESRSTVVFCVWTEFGRHYRYIVNKGTGDDEGYGCEFTIVLGVRGQEESALSPRKVARDGIYVPKAMIGDQLCGKPASQASEVVSRC